MVRANESKRWLSWRVALAAIAFGTSSVACIEIGSGSSGGDDEGDDSGGSSNGGGGSGGGTSGSGGTAGTTSGGVSCTSLCQRAQSCPDADPTVNCASDCGTIATLNASAGCTDEYDLFLRCVATVPDICIPSESACQVESNLFGDCLTVYCSDHLEECSAILG